MSAKPDPKEGYYLRPAVRTTAPTKLLVVQTAAIKSPCEGALATSYSRLRCGFAQSIYLHKSSEPTVAECEFRSPVEFWQFAGEQPVHRHALHVYGHDFGRQLLLLDLILASEAGWYKIDHGKETVLSMTGEREMRGGWDDVYQAWEDLPLLVNGRMDRGRVVLRDILNYWRYPLEKLAAQLGQPLGERPGNDATERDHLLWCRQSVTVQVEALTRLIQWWRDGDNGPWGRTMQGLGRSLYRRHYMPDPPLILHHAIADPLSRSAYFGGRIEVFRLGKIKGPVYKLDTEGAYPAVMRGRLFPAGFQHTIESPSLSDVEKALRRSAVVARVVLDAPEPLYPVRLVRVEGPDRELVEYRPPRPNEAAVAKLCYPTGSFETTLAGPELDLAMQRSHVRSCSLMACYRKSELFTEFVQALWAEKAYCNLHEDQFMSSTLKLIMNCFYGGWGMRSSGWETLPGESKIGPSGMRVYRNLDTGRREILRSLGRYWQRKITPGEGNASLCAIAAYVTSYQRLEMDRIRQLSGSGQTYAQVVDCVYVSQRGKVNLWEAGWLDPGKLGRLRVDQVLTDLKIHGLNELEHSGCAYVAGVSSRAIPETPGLYTTVSRDSFGAALANGQSDQFCETRSTVKKDRVPSKGHYPSDGWWRPIHVDLYPDGRAF